MSSVGPKAVAVNVRAIKTTSQPFMLGSTRKLSMQKKDVPLDSKRFETEHDAATAACTVVIKPN